MSLSWMRKQLEAMFELKGKVLLSGDTIQFLGRDIEMTTCRLRVVWRRQLCADSREGV